MLQGHSFTFFVVALLSIAACKEDPAEAHHRLAVDFYAKGEFAKAAAEYDEVAKLDPKLDEKVQKKGAQAWVKAGQPEKAAAVLVRLANAKQGAERLSAYKEVAGFYLQQGNNLEEAERWYGKVASEAPEDAEALSWLAELAAVRGGARSQTKAADPAMLDVALQRYERLIQLKPQDVVPHINKRIALIKYLDYLEKQRQASLADADANKADKEVAQDFKKKAEELKAKADAMRSTLEELNKHIGELNQAAKKPEQKPEQKN